MGFVIFKRRGVWIKTHDDDVKCGKCGELVRDGYEPTMTNQNYIFCPYCGDKKHRTIFRRKKK